MTSTTAKKSKAKRAKKNVLPADARKYRTALSAIRAKCKECSNYNTKEVDGCPITSCPLYTFRNTTVTNLFYPQLLRK